METASAIRPTEIKLNSRAGTLRRAATACAFACAMFTGGAGAEAINGAIYTSVADGSTVNSNLYELKSDVYLNGGPNNATCNGGHLDDGVYYFQVTDPSGATLLSSDGIAERKFTVSGGVITSYDGLTHGVSGPNAPCNSLAIQLIPFADTPNNGGVYKAWITRVSDFVAACGGVGIDCGLAGFVPGNTKTDNFKTKDTIRDPEEEFGAVEAIKFYDTNANGLFDAPDILLADWEMTLKSVSQAVDSTKFTDGAGTAAWDYLIPGSDYYVTEGTPIQGNWVHSTTIYLGHDNSPQNPAGPLVVNVNETTTVAFGNYCTVPSGGRTLGFWSNKNGQLKMRDGGTLAPELALLVSYNLRKANGAAFDPDSYSAFRNWLLYGNATNMAYMLSVQMSAMVLNVEAGFVDAGAYYVPAGMTVAQLIAAADASLAVYGYTPSGHAQRAYQEQLKTWLDRLNNGAGVLSPTPCAYSFQ